MEYRWTKRDITEFEKEYPEAYQFLLHRSLLNEYRHLATNSIILNEYEKKRLRELENTCNFSYQDVVKANVADLFFQS